jgi:hypothetical protein
MLISELAERLNEASIDFEVGRLQEIRTHLQSPSHAPCRGILGSKSVKDKDRYAFHLGGRHELQFNIGIEEGDGGVDDGAEG